MLTEITGALSALKASTELAKAVMDASKSMEKAELQLRLVEMMGSLTDARTALQTAQEGAAQLQQENQRLLGALEMKKTVVKKDDAYFETDEGGKPVGDAYCMRCWEADHVLRHLAHPIFLDHKSICHACKSEYLHSRVLVGAA
jgi:hypothetical protein